VRDRDGAASCGSAFRRHRAAAGQKGLRVEGSGAVDKRQTHRPLVNIYRSNGEEVGKTLFQEGLAMRWSPKRRNDWCAGSPWIVMAAIL